MIHSGFKDVIPWHLLPFIYMSFADNLHISKLLLLNRYGEDWLPEENTLRESSSCIFLGFVVSTQGYCDPPHPKIAREGRKFRGTECRNYVAGRMNTSDPLAEALITALKRRIRNNLLVVWKGADLEEPIFQSEEDMFVRRTRTAETEDELSESPWEVSWDLESVKSDLRRLRSLHGETYKDYLQLVVIDRAPGKIYTMIDMIEDMLFELSGLSLPIKVIQDSIRDIIPLNERKSYLEAVANEMTSNVPWPEMNANQVRYEGSRSRCWDADGFLANLLDTRRGTVVPVEHSHFITAACKDLESKATISIMEKYVALQGLACALIGSDGKLDLYVDYHAVLATARLDIVDSRFDLPPPGSLLEFASAFGHDNPTAIYAKGSIAASYCAWPMDAIFPRSLIHPNFTTPAGHMYEWVKAPFDYPLAARFWQYLLRHHFAECVDFACFSLTKFVVCATDQGDAREKIRRLHGVASRHNLRLGIPPLSAWTEDCETAGLDKIYNGVRPAGYE